MNLNLNKNVEMSEDEIKLELENILFMQPMWKLNQSYDMNMKARGCIEKFKVYLNKNEHELEHETFLQQMWK